MRHLSVLLLLLLLPVLALAEGLELAAPQEPIRPGRAVQLEFSVPETLPVSLSLLDGEEGHPIVSGWNAREGRNTVWWNGTFDGVPVAEGEYRLVLTQGSRLVSAPVTIGPVAPYLTGLSADRALITPDSPLNLGFYASEPGTVTYGISVDGQWKRLGSMSVEAGDCSLTWQPSQDMADGEAVFTLRLRGTTGELSDMAQCPVSVSGFSAGEPERYVFDDDEEIRDVWGEMPEETEALGDSGTVSAEEDYPPEMEQVPNLGSGGGADGDVFTPVWGSPYAGVDQTLNYWTLPMDITDEAAVWQMLTSPITVLDTGKKNAQRTQITIRERPDENSEGVGEVTCASQGVHVLGRYEEWAFIECYSSSFHGSRSKAWNELVQGWVPARYLRTVEPDQNMGLVVDKLTQRLYVFVEGRLYATLLCSTGKANVRQPYNETRSGEFLLVSSVGEFRSDGMWCAYGLRYNGDDLIHEVPHLKLADGSKTYVRGESRLGIKASVGCIRVQRKKDPNGVNMYWIWQNRRMNTRLVIWEDWQGRQIKVPDADSLLYYNPAGGLYYHACEHCSAAPGIDLTAFRYDSLEDAPYADLLRCEYCTPPLREAEIAEINALYAPGGDHDPALTEARQKEP